MSQEFQEHWLSAYLDNELSAEERALVERRLAEDPLARNLLEDLQRVRGLVTTLPRWQEAGFKFDASRLSQVDDFDNHEQDSHDQVNPSEDSETEDSDSAELDPHRLASPDIQLQNIQKNVPRISGGSNRIPWRGLLSMAAGLIVFLLSASYFLGPNGLPVAINMPSPALLDSAPTGAAPGAKMVAGDGEPTDSPSADSALGGMGAGHVGAFGLAESKDKAAPNSVSASEQSRDAIKPENAPASRAMPSVALQMQRAPESTDPAAAAMARQVMPSATDALAKNVTRDDSDKTNVPSAAARSELQHSKQESLGNSSGAFLCARSDTWSDDEAQTGFTLVANLASSSPQQELQPPQPSRSQEPALGASLLPKLPESEHVTKWFEQIQAEQPLTKIQIPQDDQQAKPQFDTEPKADTRSAKESELKRFDKKSAPSALGTIVLFVSQSEAQKIVDSMRKKVDAQQADSKQADSKQDGSEQPAANPFWRIVPQNQASPKPSEPGDEKVILILNPPPS